MENSQLSINQRIKLLIDKYHDGRQSRFAEAIGVSPTVINSFMPGGRESKPSYEVLIKILEAHPQLRTEWLIKGEGEPSDSNIFQESHEPYNKEKNGGLPLLVTVDNTGSENIVLVNTKAQAGYPTHLLDREYFQKLPVFNLPVPRLRNGTFRAFEVSGPSMIPTFHPGAIVIGEYVDDWHMGNIRDGYVYVVVTKDLVTVKRVLNRIHQGKLALMSDNEEFQTYQVDVEDVLQLWYVPAGLFFQFPNPRYDERRKISEIEARLLDIEDKLKGLNQ